MTVDHLDAISGHTNQTLDVVFALAAMAEYDNVTTFRFAPEQTVVSPHKGATEIIGAKVDAKARHFNRRARRIRVAVGHLIHEQEVADQQRVFH